MPSYEWQCGCGVRFEKTVRLADRDKTQACPSCKAAAPRRMPEGLSGIFNQQATGPVPQNTGIQDYDTHVDRVIGASAKQGWGVAEKRVAEKRRILKDQPQAKGEDLSRNPDGSYRVLSPVERGVHERANAINALAMEQRRKGVR